MVKKKLKEYLTRSVRKLKHRKGFGVHSPFAYGIITEVIEEKLPYYAYHRMQRTYDKQSPISFKVACLLHRLANRFHCRNVAEVKCDRGFSILPLLLLDTRLHVTTLADSATQRIAEASTLGWLPRRIPQISFVQQIEQFDAGAPYDMILISGNPFEPADGKPTPEQQAVASAQLVDWIMTHSQDDTVIFVHGIQQGQPQELFWDSLCDRDDVSITMDLFNYGLAILKPRFFKQHYIVSF